MDGPEVEDVLRRVVALRWPPGPASPDGRRPLTQYLAGRLPAARSYVLRVLDPAVSSAGLGVPPEQEIENTVAGGGVRCRRAGHRGAARRARARPGVPARPHAGRGRHPVARHDCRGSAAGLPAAARRAAVRQRLRHRGQAARAAGHLRAARPAVAGRLSRTACPQWTRSARRSRPRPLPRVPCHNDLLAENFIDVGRRRAHRRLPALRQQRPRVRARRHRGRGRLRPRPYGGADRRVLRCGGRAGARGPGAAEPGAVQRDLDAVVLRAPRSAPQARLDVRLPGRGGRQVGPGGPRSRRPRARAADRRAPRAAHALPYP